MEHRQATIQRPVHIEGLGLHSGVKTSVTLKPGEPDAGIRFIRKDLPGEPVIPAIAGNVGQVVRCTSLGEPEGASVQTVEHLLSAAYALGVDNLEVEVLGPEIPVGDGSAALFFRLLQEAGVMEQDAPRRYRRVLTPIWVKKGGSVLVALPADDLQVSCTFVSDHPVIGDQFAEFSISPEVYAQEIASARTLAFWEEIEALQKRGLGLGGDLDKVVVAKGDGYLAPLRYPDEVVRHKILDLVGDLSLAGPLRAHIVAVRPGHAVNNLLARRLSSEVTAS